VNRGTEDSLSLTCALDRFGPLDVAEAWVIGGGDPYATNDRDTPDRVVPLRLESAQVAEGVLRAELPPVSWCAIHLQTDARS
jgi:alpha-L-arabinofuranosidase